MSRLQSDHLETLDNVERMQLPSPDEFRKRYLRSAKPIIFRGVFDDEPIARVRTMRDACAAWANVQVEVGPNYIQRNLESVRATLAGSEHATSPNLELRMYPQRERVTLGAFAERLIRQPGLTQMVTDCPAPKDVSNMYVLPEHFTDPADPKLTRQILFMAGAGNASDMHTDWHGMFAVLFQIVGRKRLIVLPPHEGHKVLPLEIFGMVRLREFRTAEKLAFVRHANGFDAILEPGDVALIPRMCWHHLEYIDDGLGVSFRFGAPSSYAQFVLQRLHRDLYTQNVAVKLLDREDVEREHIGVFRAIQSEYERRYKSPLEKYRALRSLTRDLSVQLTGASRVAWSWLDASEMLEESLANAVYGADET